MALATWFILGLPVLLMTPLWWSLLGADAAVTHAAVGLALALGLAELIVLTLGTLALVDDAIPSESARALPVLGVPAVVMGSTILASAERWSALTTIGVLLALAATLPRRPTLATHRRPARDACRRRAIGRAQLE